MKNFQNLTSLVRGPIPEKPLVAIWDSAPCHVETLACLKAARGRRLLLSSGTGTTPDVIPGNMRMMVQTAWTPREHI